MADVLDHLQEARRLDAQERRDREQRWTLPTTAEGWNRTARRFAAVLVRDGIRCYGLVGDKDTPCTACTARAVVRAKARETLELYARYDVDCPRTRADAHLRAPCLDHDALVCPDTSCTGAIGDGSHDGAPPTCDTCGVTWCRCTRCDVVHDHTEPCPGCMADEHVADEGGAT